MNEEKDRIVIYQGEDGKVELRADVEKDTIWATQAQIAQLFETTPQNITLHLKNIYAEGELNEVSTCKDSLQVRTERGRAVKRNVELYNLDVIIAIGYRVNSKKATQFRIWATSVLREYVVNGHSLNRHRLENSPEALVGLYDAVNMIQSEDKPGKLKGKITIKLVKELEPPK